MSLILTRRVGETLNIGDDVEVTVLGVKGNQVRIAVNAPKEIAVHREEIYKKIQQEKFDVLGVESPIKASDKKVGKHYNPKRPVLGVKKQAA